MNELVEALSSKYAKDKKSSVEDLRRYFNEIDDDSSVIRKADKAIEKWMEADLKTKALIEMLNNN